MSNQSYSPTLTTYQWVWLVYSALPVGITTLPRTINQYTQQTGWMFLLGTALMVILFSLFYVVLYLRYPRQSIVSIFEIIAGKYIGKFLSIILVTFMIVVSGLGVRLHSDGVVTYLLFHTPQVVIIFTALLVVWYAASKGIETIAKLNEMIQPLSVLIIALILTLAANKADFKNLLPIVSEDVSLFPSFLETAYPFTVFNFIPFMFPFIANPRQLWKGITVGATLITLTILVLFIFAVAIFGTTELNYTEYPTIDIARIIQFPLLERTEIVFMIAWIPIAFTVHLVTAFASITGAKACFPRLSHLFTTSLILFLVFLMAILPDDVEQARHIAQKMDFLFIIFHFIGFPLLVFWDTLRRRWGRQHES